VTKSARQGLIAATAIVVAAATITIVIIDRNIANDVNSTLYVPKKAHMTPEIALLQQYVRIDTSNPPGNELPGAQFLAALIEKSGVKAEIVEAAPRRANVYARIRGKQRGEGLLLHNHIDVVPANPKEWDVPPFSGAIRLNMLHGRGSIDMKSIALCELEAFLDVARSGRAPEHDLVFLATADEETGSELGLRWLLEHRPDIFNGMKYAITEGGITEMSKEKVTYFGIEIGSKQIVELELVAHDEASLQRARIALEPYFRPRNPDRVLPGVREFFRAVGPRRLEYREVLTDIDATLAAGKFWLLPATMRELLQNSVWARNVRPLPDGRFAMAVALSNLPDEDPDRRVRWLTETIAPYGVTIGTIVRKEGPAPLSPTNTRLFELIARQLRHESGDIPVGPEVLALSSTDARFLRPRGMICYGLQPFPLDFFQSISVHHANERVRLDWYMSGVRMMKGLVTAWAFDSGA